MGRLAGMILTFSNCEIISVSNDGQMDKILYLQASYENNTYFSQNKRESYFIISCLLLVIKLC